MDKIQVFRPDTPTRRIAVIELSDQRRDLAILSADLPPCACLTIGADTEGRQGDQVTIVGFPDYAPGAQPASLSATITDERVELETRTIRFDRSITHGLSGGAVVGPSGAVVGVAARGAEDLGAGDTTRRHNAVHVAELHEVISA